MNIITEVIQTPITHECDVLVAGGGVAGIATAVSQEGIRRGCKKATEKFNMIGIMHFLMDSLLLFNYWVL